MGGGDRPIDVSEVQDEAERQLREDGAERSMIRCIAILQPGGRRRKARCDDRCCRRREKQNSSSVSLLLGL